MPELPTGTVTFLFTDVEESTELLQRLGERYATALDDQRLLLRTAVSEAGGREIDCRGEEFLFAFPRARDALAAALSGQRALAAHLWPDDSRLRVRMGIHTGEPAVRDDGYLGLDVHRGARICSLAHGGEVLLSHVTRDLLGDLEITLEDVGEQVLRGLARPERLFRVIAPGLPPASTSADRREAPSRFVGREREVAALLGAALRSPARLQSALGILGHRDRGLAELGWQARALIAKSGLSEREELNALARALFDAARSVNDVDRYIERIDRRGLRRRVTEYRELGVVSKRAAREAESYANQLDEVERLFATRAAVRDLARDVEVALTEPRELTNVIERVRALAAQLDSQLERARGDLGATSLKLRRTRVRGVYRLGSRYVVPYFDDLGVEQRPEFETLADARGYRTTIRVRERELGKDREPPFGGGDSGAASYTGGPI